MSKILFPLMGLEPMTDMQAHYTISLSVMSPLIGSNESIASVSLAPFGGYQKQVLPITINHFVWTTVQVLFLYKQHWLPLATYSEGVETP